jgi:curved DNA-binding protein CbpA
MKNLYKILELEKTDCKDKIKKAYRQKSTKCHPDTGGNSEEFVEVNKAYKILIDDDKRQRYDNGENVDNILNAKNNKPFEIIALLFTQALDTLDAENNNIVNVIRENILAAINKIEDEIKKQNNLKTNYEKALKKIKHKDSNNILTEIVKSKIQTKTQEICKFELEKTYFNESLKIIKDFNYDIEEIITINNFTWSTTI